MAASERLQSRHQGVGCRATMSFGLQLAKA